MYLRSRHLKWRSRHLQVGKGGCSFVCYRAALDDWRTICWLSYFCLYSSYISCILRYNGFYIQWEFCEIEILFRFSYYRIWDLLYITVFCFVGNNNFSFTKNWCPEHFNIHSCHITNSFNFDWNHFYHIRNILCSVLQKMWTTHHLKGNGLLLKVHQTKLSETIATIFKSRHPWLPTQIVALSYALLVVVRVK